MGFVGIENQYASAADVASVASKQIEAKPLDQETMKVIAGLQNQYDSFKSYMATFRQEYFAKAFPRAQHRSGKVWFKKPGKMIFEYRGDKKVGGEDKYFISNGKTLWVYEPVPKQVTITSFEPSQLSASIRFLWGGVKLTDEFNLKKLSSTKDSITLELKPKNAEAQYNKMHFVVNKQSFNVMQTIIYDAGGNVNKFWFTELERNKTYPDYRFEFTVPSGTHVIRPSKLQIGQSN